MADINSQVAEALSRGVGPQDILDHLSSSNDPEHRAWVANYKTNLIADSQPSSVTTSTVPSAPNVSGVQALGGVANKMAQSYADLPTSAQLAIPAAVAAGSYVGSKAINLGFKTLEEKLKANQEIKTQAAINALEPSPAVKVQQQQLALQQAEQANRFAQQAAAANASPVSDPLLEARVQTETQRAASEAARTKTAEAQTQLAQEKLIQQQRKAAMVKANPASAAAQVAAAESLPVEAQPTAGAQPTAAQLAEKFNLAPEAGKSTPLETTVFSPENVPFAKGAVTPPANVEPTPVTPTTTAQVVADPNITPVEKAVELTKATPAAVPPPKAPRAERGSLATIANNPAPVEGMPGMRENYTKPKGINPVTGEPFIGPGGYNWLANQVGPEAAPQMWEEQYGKRNVPHAQVQADYSATRYPPTAVTVEGQSGGAFGKQKYIPEYIKGAASPAALATTAVLTALPALGVAAVRKYQGNEAEVNASLQEAKDSLKSLVTMPYDVSKAALKGDFGPLKDLMLSMNPGSLLFNEMDKKDEEILKKMIQKEKVGAGRGMQGVPPPNQ